MSLAWPTGQFCCCSGQNQIRRARHFADPRRDTYYVQVNPEKIQRILLRMRMAPMQVRREMLMRISYCPSVPHSSAKGAVGSFASIPLVLSVLSPIIPPLRSVSATKSSSAMARASWRHVVRGFSPHLFVRGMTAGARQPSSLTGWLQPVSTEAKRSWTETQGFRSRLRRT